MTDPRKQRDSAAAKKRLKQRYSAERRFQFFGLAAISFGVLALAVLLWSILGAGWSAFSRTVISLEVKFDPEILGVSSDADRSSLEEADYYTLVRRSIYQAFPEVSGRSEKKQLNKLFSSDASLELREFVLEKPELIGSVGRVEVDASSDLDQLHKGNAPREIEESYRRITDLQLAWYDKLLAEGKIRSVFNWEFFASGDSRSAELAGIGGAVKGSFFTLIICFLLAFPIGVAAAIYLEEFAPNNRWTELIEVNINNLAAVPSIIFGLLGLAIILNLFGLPRSTPIAGGIVLALMILPVIIIACRASLKAVPPSIRQGALALGASPTQVVFHHVLPLALPGTLTGTIIGLGRALGETAPLLMIGMVAFIVDVPEGFNDAATVLPVQIYLWAESAERGFVEKTAAAIMIILTFLVFMNAVAVYLRQKFERRW